MVESSSDDILSDADNVDVAFLVVGDPFGYALFRSILRVVILTVMTEQRLTPTSSSAPANSPFPHGPSPTPVS